MKMLKIHESVVTGSDGESSMIVNIENGKIATINPIGLEICDAIKSPVALDALLTAMHMQFPGADYEQIDADVTVFINHLYDLNMIEMFNSEVST